MKTPPPQGGLLQEQEQEQESHTLSDSEESDRVVGPQDSSGQKPKTGGPKYTPGFLRWWGAYPPYRKDTKVKSFAVWRRRGLEQHTQEQLDRLEERRAYLCRENGKYCPQPTTYLSQGRDEGEGHIAWRERGGDDSGINERARVLPDEIDVEAVEAESRAKDASWEREATENEEVPL